MASVRPDWTTKRKSMKLEKPEWNYFPNGNPVNPFFLPGLLTQKIKIRVPKDVSKRTGDPERSSLESRKKRISGTKASKSEFIKSPRKLPPIPEADSLSAEEPNNLPQKEDSSQQKSANDTPPLQEDIPEASGTAEIQDTFFEEVNEVDEEDAVIGDKDSSFDNQETEWTTNAQNTVFEGGKDEQGEVTQATVDSEADSTISSSLAEAEPPLIGHTNVIETTEEVCDNPTAESVVKPEEIQSRKPKRPKVVHNILVRKMIEEIKGRDHRESDLRFSKMQMIVDACMLGLVEQVVSIIYRGDINVNDELNHSWTALQHAAYCGQADVVKVLLQMGGNPNYRREYDDFTVLMAAACYPYPEDSAAFRCAKLIIKAGGKVNVAQPNGTTPLLFAVKRGHVRIAQLLLDSEADIEHADIDFRTALDWASLKHDEGMIKLLTMYLHVDAANFKTTGGGHLLEPFELDEVTWSN